MMLMRYILFVFFITSAAKAQQKKTFTNNYFDQPIPADTPVIFAPGLVSDQFGNRDMAISPNGDEMFYTLQFRGGLISTILHSKKINDKWAKPEIASFCGLYGDLEPAFSPDGSKLYFVSNRPMSDAGKTKDYDIWYVTKENGKWTNPQNAGAPINTEKDEFYPSIAKSGNIYFTRAVEGREEDIMVCRYENDKYEPAEGLSDSVNSVADEFNAFVDPDEQYIFFSSYGRKDDLGNGDLYLSKKNEKGEWMQAMHLDKNINSRGIDYCPYITPDKKYFFFTSNRHNIKIPFAEKQDIQSLHALLQSPLNGYDNIYWMKADDIFGR